MNPKRLIYWIIWFAILSGFCAVYFFLGGKDKPPSDISGMLRFFPLVTLVAAVALRFIMLPRVPSLIRALPVFVAGLALAEGSGITATFLLSAEDARVYFAATLLVLLMHAPLFANKLADDSEGR